MKQKSVPYQVQLHYKRPLYDKEKQITDNEVAVKFLREHIDTERIDHKEFFWVMLLTRASQLIAISEISMGSSRGTIISIKEILELCLLSHADQIIAFHNHPSGKLIPSAEDIRMTRKLKKACGLMEVNLLDHIIITSENYASVEY